MKSESRRSRRLLIALFICLMAVCVGLACVFTACKSDDTRDETEGGETATVANLTLSTETLTVYAGSSKDFTVTVTMSDNTTSADYTVVSSDESVATVSQSGSTVTVTGVAAGETTVTVTAGEFTASCAVTVSADSVATVALSEESVSVAEEGTTTITVTVKMTSGVSSTDFTAESADTTIATVSVSGSTITVTGVAVGETKITVTAGGITKECAVTVTTPVISSVTLSKSNVTIGTDETASIDVTVMLDNGKATDDYTATVSCEPTGIVTASVADGILTITAGQTEGSVKITVTVDGTTIYTDCNVTVADTPKEYHIDFSDPDTYAWIGTPATPDTDKETGESFLYLDITSNASYTTGILTFQGVSGQSINKENVGALYTSSASGSYFMIDLAVFEGSYVDISVDFCANGSGTRELFVSTSTSTSTAIHSASSTGQSDIVTLSYSRLISAGDVLYLTWSTNLRIFSIDIEIVDEDPDYCHCATPTYPETTDTEHVVWDWENRDEDNQKVNVTIYCTECGKIIVSEDTEYDVDVNDATKWYASVSEGDKTYESTYDIPQEGVPYEHTYTYSYSELLTASGNVSSDTQLQAGWFTGSNEFITYTGNSTSDQIRPGQSSGCIEIKDGTLSVTFKGTGALTVGFMSTGGDNYSNMAVKGPDGVYLKGTSTDIDNSVLYESDMGSAGYIYGVKGTAEQQVTFTIETPGTYTIVFNISDPVEVTKSESTSTKTANATPNRGTRVKTIVMIDTFADGESSENEGGSSSGLTFEEIEGYEWVSAMADIAAAIDATGATSSGTKGQSEVTVGRFSFPSGMYYESGASIGESGYDVNTQGNNSITVELTGEYNNISFVGRSATSGNADMQVGIYLSGSSTALYEWTLGSSASACNYNTATGFYLEKGTYLITTSAAARLADITAYEYVEQSDPKEITAEVSTTDFLKGRNISESDLGLIVTLVYENGREDLISSGYSTDLSTLQGTADGLQLGANEITVTYSPNGGGQEFSCKVTIYLYELESIEISDFSMAYTGGTYYTNNVQKIYLTGDTVSYDYAAVTATASYGSGDDASETTFILTSSEVHFSTADASGNAVSGAFTAAGTYTVTATVDASLKTGTSVTASYEVNVVSAEGADATQVKVDGTATSITKDSGGVYTVTTINDAIQLIKLLGASDSVRKTITVAAGQYWEKIYIDIPNLSLIGANSADNDKLATRQDSTTGGTEIVYWAFNGLMDPSGTTTFSTVGSATVTVAKEAIGFYAANITFRNYWNTNDLYNQCKEINSNTQADAAYINADKSYFYNVTFTGYHDTLEAENGRQYYDHCYIEGRTDYIFGNTATCFFDKCTIHTIGSGDSKNGGYVVATKGGTSSEHVQYGYIFSGCAFDGDDQVTDGTVSIARGWDSYMTIAVINCSLTKAYSTEGYGNSSDKNDRYTKMNADPVASQLYEYGNTGDGAVNVDETNYVTGDDGIVYQVVGDEKYPLYTALTEETVKDFLDFTKIFAAVNGSYKYNDDWSGASVEIVTATVTVEGETYTVTGYKGTITVADVIAAVNEQLSGREIETLYGEDNQPVDGETKITEDVTFSAAAQEADMTVPASVTYDFSTSAIGTFGTTGWYDYLYIDLGTTGSFNDINSWYKLTGDASITVKLPAGATISIEMYEADSLAVNGTAVTATIDTNTYWYKYTVEGETAQEIKLSYASGAGSQSGVCIRTIKISVTVIYGVGDVIEIGKYTGSNIEGTTGEYLGVFIDATNGKFYSNNNAGTEVCLNAGTILTVYVESGATITEESISYYNGYEGKCSIDDSEDGVVKITATEQTYIYSLTIVAKTA